MQRGTGMTRDPQGSARGKLGLTKGLLGVSSLDQKAAMKPWTFWPKTFGADLDNRFETGPWWKRPLVRSRVDKRMKVDDP